MERLDLARPCVVPLDWFPGNEDFLKGDRSRGSMSRRRRTVGAQWSFRHCSSRPTPTPRPASLEACSSGLRSPCRRQMRLGRTCWSMPSPQAASTVDSNNPRHIDALAGAGGRVGAHHNATARSSGRPRWNRQDFSARRAGALRRRSPRMACCSSRRPARPACGFSASTGREASTIAQFLYRLGRYDGARQRPLFHG